MMEELFREIKIAVTAATSTREPSVTIKLDNQELSRFLVRCKKLRENFYQAFLEFGIPQGNLKFFDSQGNPHMGLHSFDLASIDPIEIEIDLDSLYSEE